MSACDPDRDKRGLLASIGARFRRLAAVAAFGSYCRRYNTDGLSCRDRGVCSSRCYRTNIHRRLTPNGTRLRSSLPALASHAVLSKLALLLCLFYTVLSAREQISSFQFVEMLESSQNNLLARLFDLASEKDLVEDSIDLRYRSAHGHAYARGAIKMYLVKIEDEIELADIAEECVEYLDKEVECFEIGELIVIDVDAGAEKETGVASVDDL